MKAVLGQDAVSKSAAKESPKDDETIGGKDIKSEVDFAEWYNGLELELLDSSHDDYTSVTLGRIQRQAC